jgi:predicted nucleic acid-binding protein
MTVFLDTVGLLALWDESDQWHAAAQSGFNQMLGSQANVVTTSFVLLECGNAAAWAPFASENLEGAGIVDHVSFAVMRRIGITKAFTNDRHFRAAGFETLF